MIILDIQAILNKYIDTDYKKFHEKLCHTNYEILGIKIPILRKIAKDLLKKYDYERIKINLNNNIYEYIMLEGLLIGNLEVCYPNKLILIDNFLPKIDNWAICDIFVSELKFIKNNLDIFWDFLLLKLKNNKTYYQRFVIVMLLNYYINDTYIDKVLNILLNIKNEEYYVKMAISWGISICLIKYFDKTIEFLNTNKYILDKWTYNKALQKGLESYRISKENKEILRNMKLK